MKKKNKKSKLKPTDNKIIKYYEKKKQKTKIT